MEGLEKVLQFLKLLQGEWDCPKALSEINWPLFCVVRNAFLPENAAKQEFVCVKEELQQDREMWMDYLYPLG